jgi:hypothetical protein
LNYEGPNKFAIRRACDFFNLQPATFNFPPMSAPGSKGRLTGAAKELALRWQETKNYWRDEKSAEFERKYLQELFIGVDKAVSVIEKLDELLKKVRSDCE